MSKKNLYKLLLGLSLAGYAWLAWNFTGQHEDTTVCLFKAVTGVPCPSCGTTQALVVLTRGDYRESFMVNPFGFFAALALVIVPLWTLLDVLRRRDSLFQRFRKAEQYLIQNRWVSILATFVVLLNWVWNIVKGV